ncbi:hypothetical protein ACTOV4_00640 [Brucella sp. C7-11G]
MAAMAALAPIMSGLSGIVGAVGMYQGQRHQAAQAKQQAEVGRLQADQIDTAYRDELTSTINNIRNIRASTGASSLSPTGLALEEDQKKISDRNRTRDVASKNMQATQLDQDAKYLRSSANAALFGGVAKSLPSFFGK